MYVVTISVVRLTLAVIGILYVIIMDPKILLLGTVGNFVQNFLPGKNKIIVDFQILSFNLKIFLYLSLASL